MAPQGKESHGSTAADVIIIGAGISGLNAAKWLTEAGVRVVVLEARDRVGGRTFTVNQGEFGWVDLGGSYVTPRQTHITRLLQDLGIETFAVYDDQKSVHISQGRRNVYESQWPTFDWRHDRRAADELVRVMDLMEQMFKQIPKVDPWNCSMANEWDNVTLKEFFDGHCASSEAREFLLAFCQSNVSANPAQVSLLWYLWYTKMTGGNECIWNVTDGGQELKLCGGTMQISEKIVQRIGADKVKLNKAVISVHQTGGVVTVSALDGTSYHGKYVIMATPLPLLHNVHYSPPLPPAKNALVQRAAMGTTIKCEVYYDTPFWRSKGLSGFATCGDGIDVVNNSLDDCKPGSKYGQLTCFVSCEQALKMQQLDQQGRCQLVTRFLAKAFDTEEALKPVYYVDHDWCCEQYTGGCYTATYPTGALSKYGRQLREPFGLIHFAGTETATEWSGYMSGAAQAGERAAHEILAKLGLSTSAVRRERDRPHQVMWQAPPVATNQTRMQSSLQAMKPNLANRASRSEITQVVECPAEARTTDESPLQECATSTHASGRAWTARPSVDTNDRLNDDLRLVATCTKRAPVIGLTNISSITLAGYMPP